MNRFDSIKDFINGCFSGSASVDNASVLLERQAMLERKVPKLVENYAKCTNPTLSGIRLEVYKQQLQEDITEYIDKNRIPVSEIDSPETLAKVSFERLAKASKQYVVEKCTNPINAGMYKEVAETRNQEYKLLSKL